MGHWKGEDKREDLVREVKREYEFLHPEVKINLVFNKDIEGPETGYKQRTAGVIARMIETGVIEWDVIFLDVAVYEQVSELLGDPFWVREHVVDFSEVPGFLDSQKDFIVSDTRYRNKLGGVLTGPFIENYLMNLWYNREVAEEVGLEVRERDMTMEDLYGYAEELHRYNQKHGTSITLMKLSSWNRLDYLFENLFKSLFDDFQSAVEPKLSAKKEKAFLDDRRSQVLAERYPERVIGRMIDINYHILTESGKPPPKDYYQSFIELGGFVLQSVFARKVAACAGLRNRIAHEYDAIDPEKLFDGLTAAVHDVPVFLRDVRAFLNR